MAKVRINKDIGKIMKKIRKDFVEDQLKGLKKDIIDTISKGLSPVSTQGRFKTYSDRYKEAISKGRYNRFGKKQSPINLKLSGTLHKSLKARKTLKGLTLWFSDKKAEWHNDGTDHLPRRALLPKEGETLSDALLMKMEKTLTVIAKKGFKK